MSFKDGDKLELEWNGKKVVAEVYIWDTKKAKLPEYHWEYAILMSKEFGGSRLMSFKRDWLEKNANKKIEQ